MSSNTSALFKDAPRQLTLTAAKIQWERSAPKKSKPRFVRTSATGERIQDEHSGLQPGFELLHSFYEPSLSAPVDGKPSTIHITQTIEPKATPLVLKSTQTFNVVAPEFSLPEGDIHSVYPAEGSTATAAILPHIVFNDTHLPWERLVLPPADEPDTKNQTPWLALMAFTADEILLTPDELQGANRIFASDVSQTPTLAISQKLSDLRGIDATKVKSSFPYASNDVVADFVLMTPSVFNSYFTKAPVDGKIDQTKPDLSMYRYMAHSRAINTAGLPAAGVQDDGIYSVVVSRRCGVWDNTEPVPIYVHLVSLDNVDELKPWPMAGTNHVALCSLASWTYQCLPPVSVDVADTLRELGSFKQPLAPPPALYESWSKSPDGIKQSLGQRLRDGFSLTRYVVQNGEETAAFFRGPLTPTTVAHPLTHDFKMQSTFSTDLQILDQTIGVIDITYSAAWQLGRTLGFADQAYFTALGRLRLAVHAESKDRAKRAVLGSSYRAANDVLLDLQKNVQQLHELTLKNSASPAARWYRPRDDADLSLWAEDMQSAFAAAVPQVVDEFARSTSTGYYNEMNVPRSPDWAVVLKWVLDRLFLFGLPAHYLITNPANLPLESLRFFQIDQNWTDALIDGALSLANHIDQDNDLVRQAIKKAINNYFATTDPVLKYKPQIPVFGFLLRSNLVSQFPDLQVEIPWTSPDNPRASLLRHENIDDGVLLVLLDRKPSDSDLSKMMLTQPPHQQRFVAGATVGIAPRNAVPVTRPTLEVIHKRIYTVPIEKPPTDPVGLTAYWYQDQTYSTPVFDFAARMIHPFNFATQIHWNLVTNMKDQFTEPVPTAAMLAIQLNDPLYRATVIFPPSPALPTDGDDADGPNLQMIKVRNRSGVPAKYQKWLEARKASHLPGLASPKLSMVSEVPASSRLVLPTGTSASIATAMPHGLALFPASVVTPSLPLRHLNLKKPPQSGFSNKPVFEYGVWPVSSIESRIGPAPIPTRTGIQQDLVISIVLPAEQRDVGRFALRELRVGIPYGPPTAQRTNLFAKYSGTGPTILSNLRFNVLANYQTNYISGPMMWLRILPRSVSGSVSTTIIDEISVLLPDVTVNPYIKPNLEVGFLMVEYFTFRPMTPFPSVVPISLDTTL